MRVNSQSMTIGGRPSATRMLPGWKSPWTTPSGTGGGLLARNHADT